MGSKLAAAVVLTLLTGVGCVSSEMSPAPAEGTSAAGAATEPEECRKPAVRRVCTEIVLLAQRILEPGFHALGPGKLVVTPAGLLRYDLTLDDPGNTPGAIRNQYVFVFTEVERWRRVAPPPPYDLRFVADPAKRSLYTGYEVLIDVSGSAADRASVRIEGVVQTTTPIAELNR